MLSLGSQYIVQYNFRINLGRAHIPKKAKRGVKSGNNKFIQQSERQEARSDRPVNALGRMDAHL